MSAQHTPGPWELRAPTRILGMPTHGQLYLHAKDRTIAAMLDSNQQANGMRIVQCVNAHDDLVAAGKELLDAFDNTKRDAHDRACRLQLAVASIRDAVGKTTGSAA